MIRITSPNFVAGLITRHGRVIEVAPIVCYMLGWDTGKVVDYCNNKRWKWELLPE